MVMNLTVPQFITRTLSNYITVEEQQPKPSFWENLIRTDDTKTVTVFGRRATFGESEDSSRSEEIDNNQSELLVFIQTSIYCNMTSVVTPPKLTSTLDTAPPKTDGISQMEIRCCPATR